MNEACLCVVVLNSVISRNNYYSVAGGGGAPGFSVGMSESL